MVNVDNDVERRMNEWQSSSKILEIETENIYTLIIYIKRKQLVESRKKTQDRHDNRKSVQKTTAVQTWNIINDDVERRVNNG